MGHLLFSRFAFCVLTIAGIAFSQWQWADQAGGTPGYYGNFGSGVLSAPNGDIIATGTVNRAGAFGISSFNDSLSGPGFVGCFSAGGTRKWVRFLGPGPLMIDSTGTLNILKSGSPSVLVRYSMSGDSLLPLALKDSGVVQSIAATHNGYAAATINNQGTLQNFIGISHDGTVLWQTPIKYSGYLLAGTISVSPSGDIIATGPWYTNAATDSFMVGSTLVKSPGKPGTFIIDLDSGGNANWARVFTGSGGVNITAIKGSSSGDVYAVGSCEAGATIDGQTLSSLGGFDCLLVQFTPGGTIGFAKSFGSRLTDDACNDIAIDATGKIWVTGQTGDSTILDGRIIRSSGSCDAFAVSFNMDGSPASCAMFGGSTFDEGCGIACANNNVVVTGYFSGSVDENGLSLSGQPSTSFDLFIASLNPNQAMAFNMLPLRIANAHQPLGIARMVPTAHDACVSLLGRRIAGESVSAYRPFGNRASQVVIQGKEGTWGATRLHVR